MLSKRKLKKNVSSVLEKFFFNKIYTNTKYLDVSLQLEKEWYGVLNAELSDAFEKISVSPQRGPGYQGPRYKHKLCLVFSIWVALGSYKEISLLASNAHVLLSHPDANQSVVPVVQRQVRIDPSFKFNPCLSFNLVDTNWDIY